VNSRIILSIVFYLVILPIGIIRRLAGSDPMRRRFDATASTYKVSRSQRAASHMHHQY
jgi:Saxitoxin biosynthesis operon protein SxtJ